MTQQLLNDAEKRMQKTREVLERELASIRTGRASPSLVEDLPVDYYGTPTPLKQIASITPGFVGADLANLVNEAALLAARRENQTVTMAEFNESVERVTAGIEKQLIRDCPDILPSNYALFI